MKNKHNPFQLSKRYMLSSYSQLNTQNHLLKDVEAIILEYVLLSSTYQSGCLHASVLFPCANISFFQGIVSSLLIDAVSCHVRLRTEKKFYLRSISEFPISRVYCISLLIPETELEKIIKVCSLKKKEFEKIKIKNNQCIDDLFDSLRDFQFDSTNDNIIKYIDEEKHKEKDKKSEKYFILKIIERSIHNFKKLEKKKISEATYCSVFKDIVEVILCDTEIEIDDGEMVSDASRRMAIMNDYNSSEFGRIIDVFAHQTQYGQVIEYCGIEFKTQDASDTLLKHQQSKNIRINVTMLDDMIGITQDKHISSTYMDWWGTSGYMVQLFKQNGFVVAHRITSMHIPCCLLELDSFRETLKYLYKWREQLVQLSKDTEEPEYRKHFHELKACLLLPSFGLQK